MSLDHSDKQIYHVRRKIAYFLFVGLNEASIKEAIVIKQKDKMIIIADKMEINTKENESVDETTLTSILGKRK